MRVVIDVSRVFGTEQTEDDWGRRMSNIGLAVPFGLATTGKTPDADEHAGISARVSRLIRGERPLASEQLCRLAEHTGLDRYFGSRSEAVLWLSDEKSYADFRRRLFETRWAHPDFVDRALYGSRHLLLDTFRSESFSYRRDGIRVGPDIVITAAPPGPTRGTRLPSPEDAEQDLPAFPIGSRLKVRLELDKSSAVTIFEVRPAPDRQHGYSIACLAPSPLTPERTFKSGTLVLPSQSYGDLGNFYILDHPLGRHDWLAIITRKPLALPWPVPKNALHELSAKQLETILGLLRNPKNEIAEIRHFAFMAIG